MPCKGNIFCWYIGGGKSMIRLDCFLVSGALIDRWGIVGQLIGKREVLDHCPIWIMINNNDWGHKPFRFLDCWFDNKDLIGFVEKEWKSLRVEGRSDNVTKEKLKILKGRLRNRNA